MSERAIIISYYKQLLRGNKYFKSMNTFTRIYIVTIAIKLLKIKIIRVHMLQLAHSSSMKTVRFLCLLLFQKLSSVNLVLSVALNLFKRTARESN